MKTRNMLLITAIIGFVFGGANASQEKTNLENQTSENDGFIFEKNTSKLKMLCKNEKCYLSHTHKTKHRSGFSRCTQFYHFDNNTPLIIKKNDLDMTIASKKDFQVGKVSNYFLTRCSSPEYEEFYVLEEEKKEEADCNAYSSFAAQYVVSQQKK